MSASATSLRDYVETAKQRVPRFMHPYVYEYLGWAGYHANHDDAREVARYLGLARDKIVQELRWAAESFASAHAYRDAYYNYRQADRIAGTNSDWMLPWSKDVNQQSTVRAAERAARAAEYNAERAVLTARLGREPTLYEMLDAHMSDRVAA
jgi:hypothetical protein